MSETWCIQKVPEVAQFVQVVVTHIPTEGSPHPDLYRLCLSHCLGIVSSHEFSAKLKVWITSRYPPRGLHFELRENSYFALNLKFWVLRLVRGGRCSGRQAAVLSRLYCVNPTDARLVWGLLKDHSYWEQLWSYAQLFPRTSLSWYALCHVHEDFVTRYDELQGFSKYLVGSKMRFLLKPNNMDFKDLQADLMLKGVKAYYTMLPIRHDIGYVFGCVKKAISNHAINVILKETRQKRQRIYADGLDEHGCVRYRFRVLADNQQATNPDGTSVSVEDFPDEYAANAHERILVKHSVQFLINKYRSRCPRKYRMLRLLMGTKSRRFTSWLRARNLLNRREDNSSFQLRIPAIQYNDLVIEYLHVQYSTAQRFISNLRVNMGGDQDAIVQREG